MQVQANCVMGHQAKSMDNGRIILWGFLAVLALSQLYFVRELLAAFALFALGFLAIALVVASVYLLHKSLERAVSRLSVLRHRAITIASVSEMASVGRENQKAA